MIRKNKSRRIDPFVLLAGIVSCVLGGISLMIGIERIDYVVLIVSSLLLLAGSVALCGELFLSS